jgi:hypothetical protein
MDGRKEPRLETDYPVTVTLLSDPRTSVPGRIVNYSGTGLCLDLASPLTPGAALMVEVEDTLFLGEAVYCRPAGKTHRVGVEMEQALRHTSALAALSDRLLGRRSSLASSGKTQFEPQMDTDAHG